MKLQLKNKKGFTLVELLLVVGLIALGSVVAYITYPKIQATSRANAAATQINTLAGSLNNIYAGSASFATLGTDGTTAATLLINSRAAPDAMVNGTQLSNNFFGVVSVTSATLGGGGADAFYRIQYPNVPRTECVKLVNGVGNNFSQVSVNGTAAADMAKQFPSSDVIDAGLAVSLCDTDLNTINFWGK